MNQYILSIDQGTSATKVVIVNKKGQIIAKGSAALTTTYKSNGFVEQEPEGIYNNVLDAIKKCLQDFKLKGFNKNDITAIGISNQRETFVVWDKNGKPLYNAVVWQCKRSTEICKTLNADKHFAKTVHAKTGLFIDPYFSATKLIWLLQNNANVKRAVNNGTAFFGTIDTWLLYKLTNGSSYATDHTNASRTLLFNLHTLNWDAELIQVFDLSKINLPVVQCSASHFGYTICGGIFNSALPIQSMIGDSQAAAFGEACLTVGAAKATLGTGCSLLMNIGTKPKLSKNGMVTTVCYSTIDTINYAYEGVIVSCGATIEWLKNELQLFVESMQTNDMATAVADNGGVYIIPAFSGLGSPHWQMERKAAVHGMQFGSTKNHLVRAALESIAYQIKDVIAAMEKDAKTVTHKLMINGGIADNKFLTQFLANLLQIKIVKGQYTDVSALGAALLAGLNAGIFSNLQQIEKLLANNTSIKPARKAVTESNGYLEWQRLIKLKY